MGKVDCHRHIRFRFVARIAEHHALVARAVTLARFGVRLVLQRLVNAHGNVARLLVNSADNAAGVAVKSVLRTVIADLAHRFANDFLYINIRFCAYLADNHHKARGNGNLAGNARLRILRENRVKNRVRNQIGNLVRMSFRHRLRCEQLFVFHFNFLLYEPMFNSRRKADPAVRNAVRLPLLFA